MKAKLIKGKTTEEIQSALELCIVDTCPDNPFGQGFKPTLALVFLSVSHDRNTIIRLLDSYDIQIFGATTGGEIAGSEILHQGISILLLDIDPGNFRILLREYKGKDPLSVAKAMSAEAMDIFKDPAFILSNSFDNPVDIALGENILYSITEVVGKEANVWGGGAGDDLQFLQSFVFSNNLSSNTGILMLIFDSDKVIVKGKSISGMKPVGTEKTVTRAEGNWIFEVDHKPAAELIPKYVGVKLTDDEYKDFNLVNIYLSVLRDEGEPIIRTTAGFSLSSKAIAVTGSIKEGDKLRLALEPDFETMEETSLQAKRFKQSEMPEADALLMFSCIGRLNAFGPTTCEELAGVQTVFDAPMAGFFTYGEYGRATQGKNEFHNMTCCWVVLKEK